MFSEMRPYILYIFDATVNSTIFNVFQYILAYIEKYN